MGVFDINVPPIPVKEGKYDYYKGNIIYIPKGKKAEDGTIVAPYIPPKRIEFENGRLEDEKDYNKRISADVNRVIGEIETSKKEVDAKARKHAINSTYELGDTGLTFASALEKAIRLFNGIEGKITKDDITIKGIMVKSARAGIEEIKEDIVGDLEKGFNLGDFFAKYGPALNEAIWKFGYRYGKNGLTNRHLLYMVYIVKKNNILNAFAAEIMEMTMVKGLYILHEAILIANPNIKNRDGFFKKVKKYSKAIGKKTMDLFEVIQGLFWIFVAGPVSDLIKERVDNNIFSNCDKAMMDLLGIKEGNEESIEQQESNKDYTDSFEDIYNSKYQQIDQILKNSLLDAKKMEIDLGKELEDTFGDFLEKFKNRYSIISKIFGADKAYTVYNMKNIGDNGIKVVKEEKIDGPGIGYGTKILIGEGAVQWGNVQFFGKFQKKSKRKNVKPRKGSSVTEVFAHLAINTKKGNYVTRQAAEAGVLATQLNFLRKDIVFNEAGATKFEGLLKLHGDIDDISALVQTMFDNGAKIESISDFLAYFDKEGKRELEEYIKDLENDKSNGSSLESPERERYSLIGYRRERQKENDEIKKREISIGYAQDFNKELVEYVELLRENFPKLYQKTDNISLTSKKQIFCTNRSFAQTINFDFFKVKKITLEEVAELKGIIKIEKKRGRLDSNQDYIGNFITVDEIIEYNKKKNKGIYKLGISPKGDYLILYVTNSSIYDANQYFFLYGIFNNILAAGANDIKDVKFPYEKYIPNNSIFYGSADSENPPEGKQEKYEFYTGTNHSYHYKKKRNKKIKESKQKLSNPNAKIIINGKQIGSNLERRTKWESLVDSIQKQQEYEEIIECRDNKILELKYIYDFNGGWISLTERTKLPFLKIKYRYIDKKIENQDGFDQWNELLIKEFEDLDYQIDIPDKGDSLSGSRSNKVKKETELDVVDTKKVIDNGKGIIKINGKNLKADKLTKITKKKPGQIYEIKKRDTLWEIAVEHYKGDGTKWIRLEKEDGTNFTEEEANKLAVGTKVYIPQD